MVSQMSLESKKVSEFTSGNILTSSGQFIMRYSLVFFLLVFGAAKWTADEANGIKPWLQHNPIFSWLYNVGNVQTVSEFFGVIEISLGLLILARRLSPTACLIGSMGCIPMFLTTLSFLVTGPNDATSQGFLLKDLTLLGVCLWSAGESYLAKVSIKKHHAGDRS